VQRLRIAAVLIARPSLWLAAARQLWRLAPNKWWARAPFLPVPSREYLRFRLVTHYGDAGHPPTAEDVVSYLQWCRQWERLRGEVTR
jgi:hypothetical protein